MDTFGLLMICLLLTCCSTVSDKDCSVLEEGTFTYLDNINDPTAFFIIRGSRHIEFHQEKRYQIESNLTWINPCEYELQMLSSNYEDFPFQAGDRINIRIDAVRGDTISYTATAQGSSPWKSRVLKVGN